MRTKATFLLGGALGYVLGARAGRERYEQIRRSATRMWENPKVQQTVGDVEEKAAETAKSKGHDLQDKASAAAKNLLSTAQQKVREHRSGDSGGMTPTYETTELPGTRAQAGSNGRID